MSLSIWNSIFQSLFSTQLTRNILRNFSKKFSPTWRSFNKFVLLVTSSKTQLGQLQLQDGGLNTVFGQNISGPWLIYETGPD